MIIPFGSLALHAKNTDKENDGIGDLEVRAWNIYHVPAVPPTDPKVSKMTNLVTSDYIYATPMFNPNLSEFPFPPPEVGQGTWFHITAPHQYHITANLGSAFIAKMNKGPAIVIDVVHVGPENIPAVTEWGILLTMSRRSHRPTPRLAR